MAIKCDSSLTPHFQRQLSTFLFGILHLFLSSVQQLLPVSFLTPFFPVTLKNGLAAFRAAGTPGNDHFKVISKGPQLLNFFGRKVTCDFALLHPPYLLKEKNGYCRQRKCLTLHYCSCMDPIE